MRLYNNIWFRLVVSFIVLACVINIFLNAETDNTYLKMAMFIFVLGISLDFGFWCREAVNKWMDAKKSSRNGIDDAYVTKKVLKWAKSKDLTPILTTKEMQLNQFNKLQEEVQELYMAMNATVKPVVTPDIKDAIGDIMVVLTILAKQHNTSIGECYELAYDEIKDRTGFTIDGVFFKEI